MTLPSKLLFIADIDVAGEKIFSIIDGALKGGCRWVMLRGIKQDRTKLLAAAKRVKALCLPYKASFFVSREVEVARQAGADGVHLPADSRLKKIDGLITGQSCHSEGEIRRAYDNGMDYVTLSPIFPTTSKAAYGPALGVSKLQAIAGKASLPICALGGITPDNASACLKAKAASVAVLGGIVLSPNPEAITRTYLARLG
jgi:thiamine-phosphate pyrophosphorylase